MLRRLVLLALPSLCLAFGGCTASDPQLAQLGQTCDEDLQCATPLVCACVEIRGTGDDGNDEIVRHGTCQRPGFLCVKDDAGGDVKFDTAPLDAHRDDTGADVEPDATTDTTTGDTTIDDATTADGDESGG